MGRRIGKGWPSGSGRWEAQLVWTGASTLSLSLNLFLKQKKREEKKKKGGVGEEV